MSYYVHLINVSDLFLYEIVYLFNKYINLYIG